MNKVKGITERLVDGYRDYFNNVESFDGRYVCGQLFLYGRAKAFDIGIPNEYGGTNQTKLSYFVHWFNHFWFETEKELKRFVNQVSQYDVYHHTSMRKIEQMRQPIKVTQYVPVIAKLTEALQFLNLNDVQITQYRQEVVDILNDQNNEIKNITLFPESDINAYFIKSLKTILMRLHKDYDGENLYPTATMTFLSCLDQLQIERKKITHPFTFQMMKINNDTYFTEEHIHEFFFNHDFGKLIEGNIVTVFVLLLKSYQLHLKNLTHIENCLNLMNETLTLLLKE